MSHVFVYFVPLSWQAQSMLYKQTKICHFVREFIAWIMLIKRFPFALKPNDDETAYFSVRKKNKQALKFDTCVKRMRKWDLKKKKISVKWKTNPKFSCVCGEGRETEKSAKRRQYLPYCFNSSCRIASPLNCCRWTSMTNFKSLLNAIRRTEVHVPSDMSR